MQAKEIKKNIYWVGVKDWNLKEFHGYSTPNGSSYNSYLIMDKEIALIDGVKAPFSAEMLAKVSSVTDFDKISYLVVNHVEMDHSGNIPEIIKLAPQIKIITDMAGKMALEAHFDTTNWQYLIVKSGDKVELGERTLEFVTTPMLHWPDSMMTYVRQDKLLLSNDGFGQHLATSGLFVSEQPFDLVVAEAKSYFANILLPYCSQAQKALNTTKELGLDIDMIAPSHGSIWAGKSEVECILGLYDQWSSGKVEEKAIVVYDSMWGATESLANKITSVFENNNIMVKKYCLSSKSPSEIMADFIDAKYVCVGSPTLNNNLFPRVAMFLTYMKGLAPKNKKAMAFGSYGWKSGVVNEIKTIFEALGWQTNSSFEIKYTPRAKDLENLEDAIKELIKS